jgi:2-hydroxy-3-keto-5-methylthiopentenyl-1-phosphate phosphatase
MSEQKPADYRAGILVSDFDGTMTRVDFFTLALECLVPPNLPGYWDAYLAGRMTHFEVLRAIYGAIRTSESEALAVLPRMGLDPNLAPAVAGLRQAGWEVVVASAGCAWYILRLLAERCVELEVHSNPGHFETGRGLVLGLPVDSPFFSPTLGIDKAGVVRAALATGRPVAFAGDGYPDADAARLVRPELRFARRDLAEVLTGEGLPFRLFEVWSDVSRALTNG